MFVCFPTVVCFFPVDVLGFKELEVCCFWEMVWFLRVWSEFGLLLGFRAGIFLFVIGCGSFEASY